MYLLVKTIWTCDSDTKQVTGLYDDIEAAQKELKHMALTADENNVYFTTYEDDCIEYFEIIYIKPNTTYNTGINL